jgi:hypothetical protein
MMLADPVRGRRWSDLRSTWRPWLGWKYRTCPPSAVRPHFTSWPSRPGLHGPGSAAELTAASPSEVSRRCEDPTNGRPAAVPSRPQTAGVDADASAAVLVAGVVPVGEVGTHRLVRGRRRQPPPTHARSPPTTAYAATRADAPQRGPRTAHPRPSRPARRVLDAPRTTGDRRRHTSTGPASVCATGLAANAGRAPSRTIGAGERSGRGPE